MHKTLALTLAIAMSGTALAQSTTAVLAKTPYSAYLQDGRGVIVRSNSGLCWRTNYWTPADAVLGCDGDLVPPIAVEIAPPIAPSTPKPERIVPAPLPVIRCDFSLTLKSDQTFNFNSVILSTAAKNLIDTQFRSKLASCPNIESIVVSGYTDRLGSDNYNQVLSEARASVVAEYLRNSGVKETIGQRGFGKRQELVTCDGITNHKKLVDCLAPNRRVEIEVHGTSR